MPCLSGLRERDQEAKITNPTLFRALMLLFPVVAEKVSDRYGDEFTTDNFAEVLRPALARTKKGQTANPGNSPSVLYEASEAARIRLFSWPSEAVVPLAAAALLPSLVTQLGSVGSNLENMTLADLVMPRAAGYDLSVVLAPKSLILDFREPTPVASALASDCGRFSCAAFQSLADIAAELDHRDTFAWGMVKLYYASFYAAHALLRTLGEGCSFFYKRHVDRVALVADAYGILPPFRIDAGLYHCVLHSSASAVTYNKAASASGGTHEAFWLVFGRRLTSVAESVLTGSLPRADAQAVYGQLDQMLQILNRKPGFSWLSGVRNDLQYRFQHSAWYPETVRAQDRRELGRVARQWSRDPMTIALTNQSWGLLGDFALACAFIVALCREVLAQIAERSSRGRQSFATTRPMAFLNDIAAA